MTKSRFERKKKSQKLRRKKINKIRITFKRIKPSKEKHANLICGDLY